MPADEAAALRQKLEAAEAAAGGKLEGGLKFKPHLLYPWLYDLVCDPPHHRPGVGSSRR